MTRRVTHLCDHGDAQYEHADAHEEREDLSVGPQDVRVLVNDAGCKRLHLTKLQRALLTLNTRHHANTLHDMTVLHVCIVNMQI